MKLSLENTKAEYSHETVVDKYISCVEDVGLWKSERIAFEKYLNQKNKILDLGCGAGRTTFGLYDMCYTDIVGLDLSEEMISAAKKIANDRNVEISFVAGNACDLPFDTSSFDAVIFSFNGIMTIPTREMRRRAFDEIHRVLKPGGIFVFTTHDMNNPQFIDYWNEEYDKWQKDEQDKRLLEYGDLIFSKPDDYGDAVSFIHVPLDGEVETYLKTSGFHLINNELRSNICEEKTEVLDFSADCRFWVAKKTPLSEIQYRQLNIEDIHPDILSNFSRYQEVKKCWRKQNGEWVLIDNHFVDDWDATKKKELATHCLPGTIECDGTVFGAFDAEKLIGFFAVAGSLIGSRKQYTQLISLQVSCEYRHKGIGKKLFELCVNASKKTDAKKLYISAHSSQESQAFYRAMKCVDTEEIIPELFEAEPYDVHMEFVL